MKKIKLTMTTLIVCFLSSLSYAQLNVDDFYENKEEYLIRSVVEELDSISSKNLITSVKNWGGVNFANMKEVLVSETENQLVFNYITNSFYTKALGMKNSAAWYIRLVVQVKDNRIRLLFYDDGNAYWPATYTSTITVPATSARRMHFADYFKNGVTKKTFNDGLLNVKSSIDITSGNLIDSIKNKQLPNVSKTSDDW